MHKIYNVGSVIAETLETKNEKDRAIVSNLLFAETIIEKHRLQYFAMI